MLGYDERGLVVGCIGVESALSGAEVVLQGLAVEPKRRSRGIGRMMVREVAARFRGATLMAETDADAAGFYRRCGFAVESLREKYPGAERFRCTLSAE